ncbi:MAG: aldo/keto reductase [Cyclobacteriaceae bacterium]
MKYLEFKNGDKMPILGLGTWKSDPGEVYQAVKTAIDLGYRHIDCAFIYGNENEVGEAVNDSIREGKVKRSDLWITSKLWNSYHAKEDVRPGIEATLQLLKLDYLDLYLMHWPVALKSRITYPTAGSDFVPLEQFPLIDTWIEMIKLQESGLTKHIGVSNFSISKIKSLTDLSGVKPEMNQCERHPYFQQQTLIEYCKGNGIHFTCYSPLGSPDRPARVVKDDAPILLENPTISNIARDHQISPAQVILSWTVAKALAVVPKSVNSHRLADNIASCDITLTNQEIELIDGLDKNYRYIDGSFWAMDGSPYTIETLWD